MLAGFFMPPYTNSEKDLLGVYSLEKLLETYPYEVNL